MKKNKNNFMGSLFFVLTVASLFYFLLSKTKKEETLLVKEVEKLPQNVAPQRAPTSLMSPNKTNEEKTENNKISSKITSLVPSFAPSTLNKRWSHSINSEDDLYIDTQLNLDGIPLDSYNYRWKKDNSGEASELVAGILPQIKSVNGGFPSQEQSIHMAEDAVNREGDLLSVKEVWSLSSNKILTPQLKVEVQVKSRTQDSAGHEFWYISINTGKIVKRTEADRY